MSVNALTLPSPVSPCPRIKYSIPSVSYFPVKLSLSIL
nr:MAG TPA: hypothetical protein [Bacteriophage sp.]